MFGAYDTIRGRSEEAEQLLSCLGGFVLVGWKTAIF
jgi:hypothetical protein